MWDDTGPQGDGKMDSDSMWDSSQHSDHVLETYDRVRLTLLVLLIAGVVVTLWWLLT